MKEPIERELKSLVKEEDMNFIIKSYDLNKYKIQTNIYYDTLDGKVKQKNGAVRIRIIDDLYIFTLKIRKDAITHFEYEKEVDTKDLLKIKDEEILTWLKTHDIPFHELIPIVSFTTKRYEKDLERAALCADITQYDHHVDYELEYEYKYEHDGISYFNQILKPIHLQYIKNCPSKIARAFNKS